MKRKLFALLLSAALVCTNISITYAADLSSTEAPADGDESMEDKSMEKESMEDKSMEKESMEDKSMEDNSMENASIEKSSIEDGQETSVEEGEASLEEGEAEPAASDSENASQQTEPESEENSGGTETQTESEAASDPEPKKKDAGRFHSGVAPAIDGTFGGWETLPVSYEYNWDNSSNCWEGGCWTTDPETGKPVCYKTEKGTYDSNVRHEMQLYCDEEAVYLRIKYAAIYEAHANGDDFNFYVDGVSAKFSINWQDGSPITGTEKAAGTYEVDVRNGDSASSYSIVDGACAYYRVAKNGVNNELELTIPLAALQAQNGAIDIERYSKIQFFTPNLMYRRISTAGSSTGALPFAVAAFLCISAGYVYFKRKNKRERAFT